MSLNNSAPGNAEVRASTEVRSAEIREKSERVRQLLETEALDGLLLGAQHNFSWLSAGGVNGIDLGREGGCCALLFDRQGRRFVIASNIDMACMRADSHVGDFEPVELRWWEEKANPNAIVEAARGILGPSAVLGSDQGLAGTRGIEGAVSRLRFRLTADELRRYRELGRDAGVAVGEVCRALTPGLSELEISQRIGSALSAKGIRTVVCLVGADERLTRFRHPVATDNRFQKIVLVAAGARRHGLTLSLTRIVSVGPISADLQRRTHGNAHVMARLLAATRPGASGGDVFQAAVAAYAEVGFAGEERLHHQGGPCGYRTRDWIAFPGCGETVQAPQAFAWNPSITGTKVEETCIVSDSGYELITSTPGWPTIPAEAGGAVFTAADILKI